MECKWHTLDPMQITHGSLADPIEVGLRWPGPLR
jgi:hypothetical protein